MYENAFSLFISNSRKFPVAKHTAVLNLVKFKGEYFPFQEADFRLLRSRSVTVFRISESTLDILSKALLKGVKIEQHSWGSVYPDLLTSFKDALTESSPEETHGFKHEQNWLMIQTDTEKCPDLNPAIATNLETKINQLKKLMGRYGIQANVATKNRKDHILTRIEFVPNDMLIPAFYFGSEENWDDPLFLDFNLGKSARLRFSKRDTVAGLPTFAVAFEDRFGDHFQEAFTRGFPFSQLSTKDCEEAIAFFVSLHARTTIKRK